MKYSPKTKEMENLIKEINHRVYPYNLKFRKFDKKNHLIILVGESNEIGIPVAELNYEYGTNYLYTLTKKGKNYPFMFDKYFLKTLGELHNLFDSDCDAIHKEEMVLDNEKDS